ncbi:MAG: M48 family metalloprotease [Bacteroidota bacterium]
MRWIFLSLFLLHSFSSSGQNYRSSLGANSSFRVEMGLKGTLTKRLTTGAKAGDEVEVRRIFVDPTGYHAINLTANGKVFKAPLRRANTIQFRASNLKDFWKIQALQSGVYSHMIKNGLQKNLRTELGKEAYDYIETLDNSGLLLEDDYLESYLQGLAFRVMPDPLDDGRPGSVRVKVVMDYKPNAFMFPNGMMFLTTGLLSTMSSEEELLAVMAHEVAHFAEDHSMQNINTTMQRTRRALFWSSIATLAAASAEIYMTTQDETYQAGGLTQVTASLSTEIASRINERMGLTYTQQQEFEADKSATELLEMIKVNPMALASALKRIKRHNLKMDISNHYNPSTHPNINLRISKISGPAERFNDSAYIARMAMVNSMNAQLAFYERQYAVSIHFAHKNFGTRLATENDYLLVAKSLMKQYNTPEKNQEALFVIQQAKDTDFLPSFELFKQEGLLYLRLEKEAEAKESFHKYLNFLEQSR